VHPGDKDLPVIIKVDNPGATNARIETIQLTFTQGGLDVTSKMLHQHPLNLQHLCQPIGQSAQKSSYLGQ
jgi:hypothetical protein